MSDLPLPPLAYHESPLAESICAKLTLEEGHFLDDLFGEHARTAVAAAEPRRTYEEFMAAPIAAEPVAYEYEHEDGGARLAVHVEQDHEGLHKSWTKIGDLFRAHSPVPAEPVATALSELPLLPSPVAYDVDRFGSIFSTEQLQAYAREAVRAALAAASIEWHSSVPMSEPIAEADAKEAWIQEALRLADEHGRHWVLDGPARRAALEAHLRNKG